MKYLKLLQVGGPKTSNVPVLQHVQVCSEAIIQSLEENPNKQTLGCDSDILILDVKP